MNKGARESRLCEVSYRPLSVYRPNRLHNTALTKTHTVIREQCSRHYWIKVLTKEQKTYTLTSAVAMDIPKHIKDQFFFYSDL